MAESNEEQFNSVRHRGDLSRGKVVLLVGLALVIVAASAVLFSPIVPNIIATFNAHSTSAAFADDAPMFGFNAEHTRFNPREHILTYSTVSHLVPDWTSSTTGGSIFSSPVASNGVVYVGSYDARLYAFEAAG